MSGVGGLTSVIGTDLSLPAVIAQWLGVGRRGGQCPPSAAKSCCRRRTPKERGEERDAADKAVAPLRNLGGDDGEEAWTRKRRGPVGQCADRPKTRTMGGPGGQGVVDAVAAVCPPSPCPKEEWTCQHPAVARPRGGEEGEATARITLPQTHLGKDDPDRGRGNH